MVNKIETFEELVDALEKFYNDEEAFHVTENDFHKTIHMINNNRIKCIEYTIALPTCYKLTLHRTEYDSYSEWYFYNKDPQTIYNIIKAIAEATDDK